MAGMPQVQEHFAAPPWMAGMPQVQEHFAAPPWMAGMQEMQEHFPARQGSRTRRKHRCNFLPRASPC